MGSEAINRFCRSAFNSLPQSTVRKTIFERRIFK
jgi:hypothetical protein